MATSVTWATLKAEILRELDLQGEDFITATELMDYANDAIDEAEAEIMTIYEKYFETEANLSVTSGVATVSMPTGIYANKITCINYDNGSTKYEVKRIKNLKEIPHIQAGQLYRYRIINPTGGYQIKLYPTPTETTSTYFTCYYLRNANAITADATVIDLPEAKGFIKAHIKARCMAKEGFPGNPAVNPDVEKQRQLLIETLENMVPDENNEIEPDMSFYDDFYGEFYDW